MKTLLEKKVEVLNTESWIIPVVYGDETRTLEISDFLQRNGVDGQPMNFPAVPKGMARIRLFITSEHTKEQIEKAVEVIFKAAEKFGLRKKEAEAIVKFIFQEIAETVKKGERVSIQGFGAFELRELKERRIRNPRTGKVVKVPERYRVVFVSRV